MPGIDVHVRDKIDASITRKLREQGRAATSTANAIERLNNAMASMSRTTGLGAATGSMNNFSKASGNAQRSFGSFIADLTTAEGRFNALSASVMNGVRGLRSLLGAIFVVGLNLAAIEKIDSFKSMQNQLRLTTTSTEQLNSVTAQLFEVAERARVPVESLVRSFRRFDSAMAKVGRGQSDTLRMTETVGKMLTLAGANANESASALLQLSQAFNKGKLDGDEFRSVAELMPQVLDALEKSLGKTRGELFKLSRQGELTSQKLMDAILEVSDEVDAKMAGLPRTIGNAVTSLMNTILMEFGKFDMASGFSDKIVAAFDALRDNLPTVLSGLQGVGAALLFLASPSILHFFGVAAKFFLNLPGMVALGIGLFTAFSDKIKVSGSETQTLADRMNGLFEMLTTDISLPGIDSVNIMQKAWDGVALAIEKVVFHTAEFMAVLKTSVELISQLGLKGILDAWEDGLFKIALTIRNEVVDALVYVAELIDKLFVGLTNALDQAIITPINALLGKLGDLVNQFDKSFASITMKSFLPDGFFNDLANTLKTGIQIPKGGFDTGFIEALKGMKVEMGDVGKKWEDLNKKTNEIHEGVVYKMHERWKVLMETMTKYTEEAAEKRIATEEKVRDAFTAKPELNRADDPYTQQTMLRHQQIMDYKEAMEKAAQASGILGQVLQANAPFTEGFTRKIIEQETALKGFKSELDLSKISLSELIEGWKDDPAFAAPIKEAEAQIESLRKTMEQMSPEGGGSSEAIQGTTDAIQTMEESINNATSSIHEMGTSFVSVTSESSEFTGSATADLFEVSSVAGSTGYEIDGSLTSAFQSGTAAVNDFADNAIARLNEVASAASGISFGGGGGLMGFARGGYTGNAPKDRIAGVVHGQEYVMPADATRQYRPLLDAMRSGSLSSAGTSNSAATTGGAMKVSVHNYGSSKISVQQISQDEIRIIAREEAERSVQSSSGDVVAAHLRNPNSKVSRSISAHTNAQRRR